ncbi:hypothetical protein CEXT_196051 [Caerostris extrusa]|uniref:C2H2-type domain-containing protein n=1 Tax=Caerostris extrusa TaxID=172846 RepID=A0AAV4XRB5_CAEEX|nr:hypothetical protein CEXT_196051 [Caerostris extrusa]
MGKITFNRRRESLQRLVEKLLDHLLDLLPSTPYKESFFFKPQILFESGDLGSLHPERRKMIMAHGFSYPQRLITTTRSIINASASKRMLTKSMEIRKCEFCKAYITNFEVHNCVRFGNQHRRTSATLPQRSSDINSLCGNRKENTDISEPQNPNNITDAISLPSTSQYSSSVTCSSEKQKACKISTTTAANESNATYGNHSDQILSRISSSSEELDTTFGNTRRELYKCGKELSSTLPLAFSERSHAVARPNRSNVCDEAFADSSSPSTLVRKHPGDKSYKCVECGKCYEYPSQLREHSSIARTQQHYGETLYSCGECDKSFVYQNSLNKHLRIHTGEMPHTCRECGKCFAVHSELTRHTRTHSREKPYACNKCCKRYTRNSDLKRHMLKHADEERSKCDSCGVEFSSEESLEAHECRKTK